MYIKYIFFLLLLISAQILIAQDNLIKKRIDKIDSLIYNSCFDEAQKKIEETSIIINFKPQEKREWELIMLLQKAKIFMLSDKNIEASELIFRGIDLAKKYNFPEYEFKAKLMAACLYEIIADYDLCKKYLDESKSLCDKHKLYNKYSNYCIRASSYYRFTNNLDSAIYFAQEGLVYGEKYSNKTDVNDAYLLLGILLTNRNYKESIKYSLLAAREFMQNNDYAAVAAMYSNVSVSLNKHNQPKEALLYIDSTFIIYNTYKLDTMTNNYAVFLKNKTEVFVTLEKYDSAFVWYKRYHNIERKNRDKKESLEIKNISERYQNDKKEIIIANKNQQLIYGVIFIIVIVIVVILLVIQNKKINAKNKIISNQVDELFKMLEQKQILLSELQHRVKNNLQHVISILEIQKESVTFNNIDELIRSNQNRIRSMALLHNKLNISENVNEVDLSKYIAELSDLIKKSYDDAKKIQINLTCDIKNVSIDKALPIGLIIVELISNSMKYAFKKMHSGIINIILTEKELHYTDNGIGFDFYQAHKKGLGLEIVKGLIEQLDAKTESNQNNGFELKLFFK